MSRRSRIHQEISVFAVYGIYSSVIWGYVFSKCQTIGASLNKFIVYDKCLIVGVDYFTLSLMRFFGFLLGDDISYAQMMVSVSVAISLQLISVYLWFNFITGRLNIPSNMAGYKKILWLFMMVFGSHLWIYNLFNDYMTKSYVIISVFLFIISWYILDRDDSQNKIGILKIS